MNQEVIHGIPVVFPEVEEDRVYGGCNQTFKEIKQGWIDYLSGSDAVKLASPKIEKMEVLTMADLYWRGSALKFHCKHYEKITTLDQCEMCPHWSRPDNECLVMDDTYTYVEKQPITKDIALDTMHVIRITLKEKKQ